MKAKELMINDWVKIDEPDKYAGSYAQIKSLYHYRDGDGAYFDVFIFGEKGLLTTGVYCDDLRPVPITGKILKKNGFTDGKYRHFNGNVWKLEADGFREIHLTEKVGQAVLWGEKIKPDYPNSVGDKFTIPFIRYVHELQHAMKLIGIDKKFEL